MDKLLRGFYFLFRPTALYHHPIFTSLIVTQPYTHDLDRRNLYVPRLNTFDFRHDISTIDNSRQHSEGTLDRLLQYPFSIFFQKNMTQVIHDRIMHL